MRKRLLKLLPHRSSKRAAGDASGTSQDIPQQHTPQGASTSAVVQASTHPPAEAEENNVQTTQFAITGEGKNASPGAQAGTAAKRSGWDIAIQGGIVILTLAKGILGNFSFPGTDVAFDVAIGIVKHVKVTD